MMNRKGISPIIAAVLLMAVTLSIAALFSGWGPDLINTVTGETTNQTEETIDCNRASVEIMSAKYYSANASTTVVTRNNGDGALNDLRASAWNGDIPMNETTFSLEQGNFTAVNITTTQEPTEVQVLSGRCGSVTDISEDIS